MIEQLKFENDDRQYIMYHTDNGKWKYYSGKYKFIRADKTFEIFYLRSAQAKLLCQIYERLGFTDIKVLEKIHDTDLPRWERIE